MIKSFKLFKNIELIVSGSLNYDEKNAPGTMIALNRVIMSWVIPNLILNDTTTSGNSCDHQVVGVPLRQSTMYGNVNVA